MGFDVFGKATEDNGERMYFRNNVWYWRPLWAYCHIVAPDIVDEDTLKRGMYNDGHGLDGPRAKELAQRLRTSLKDGTFTKQWTEHMNSPESQDYPLVEENVMGFANFCDRCEGFEIY